jgi:choice-of-anchor B domain-containing protein
MSSARNLFAAALMAAMTAGATAAMADSIEGLRLVAKIDQHHDAGYSAIWGYTAPDGHEYALLGARDGTSIVDITDEANIHEAAFIPGPTSTWRELKTFSHYAYVVTDSVNSGVQIIDLSTLPGSAALVATFSDYPQSHTIWIDNATATMYLMGGSGEKVVAFSLENPLEPRELSLFGTTYVHDAYIANGRAYLAEIKSRSFSIWDVQDPSHPTFISRYRDENAPNISFHNAWPYGENDRYLVTTEETSGRTVKIWDIADPQHISMVSEFIPPNQLAHNVQIKGHYIYYSSYGGGVRITDIADPAHPVEVAHWARGTGRDEGFVSTWGCYPFFPSGKVVGSDMQGGLVVLDFPEGRDP